MRTTAPLGLLWAGLEMGFPQRTSQTGPCLHWAHSSVRLSLQQVNKDTYKYSWFLLVTQGKKQGDGVGQGRGRGKASQGRGHSCGALNDKGLAEGTARAKALGCGGHVQRHVALGIEKEKQEETVLAGWQVG